MNWNPDTCECVIEYKHIAGMIANEPTYFKRMVNNCSRHPTGNVSVKVLEENQLKNRVIGIELQNIKQIEQEKVQYYFDDLNILHLKNLPLTAAQKTALKNGLDTRFGTNKVIVD